MSAIINALKGSLEGDPENWETRLALIEACQSEGQYDEAIDVINGAESLPSDDKGLVCAAKCYVAVGATDQAHGIYAAALEVNPENTDAKAGISVLEAQAAADQPAEEATPAPSVGGGTGTAAAAAPAMTASPTFATASAGEKAPAPVIVRNPEDIDPDLIAEAEMIHQAEEESERKRLTAMRRDKINAVVVTVLLHVLVIGALMMVVTHIPANAPPQIVASSMAEQQQDQIETQTMKRPTQTASSSAKSMTDIVSVQATSAFAFSSVDVESTADMGFASTGMDFAPSMDMGMEASSDSKMMFGQKMEGDVLGVILDVSGSMAEYLPHVVREVDKNFKHAPIVYVRDTVMRKRTKEPDVRLIIPEEVKPRWADDEHSPYWFLWSDLPRKAPQRYVDRLIETFKTRPNSFLAIRSQGDMVTAAIDFLVEQKIDSLYIFSDYEDFVDEELAKEIGQNLGRRKIRTYVQPAEKTTDNLNTVTNKIARRTLGRQMPSLVSIFQPDDGPTSLTVAKPKDMTAEGSAVFNYATPRDEMIGTEGYHWKPSKNMTEITRLEEKAFDAVFYGPEARAEIFLKDENGGYIQNPIRFWYHSWKKDPERAKDPAYRGRRRKFLRLEEDPTFDGKEIVWKMVLEDELKFKVHMFIGGLGTQKLFATYTAEPPKDESHDHAHISFWMPRLAHESGKQDVYFGQDLPAEGLTDLDDIRLGVKPNTVVFNLPRQDRDKYKSSWEADGFEPGYNTKHYHELIRVMPRGIRDVKVEGPSFGPRKIHARTSSSKVLLSGWTGRRDTEPWEGFAASLVRSKETREKFTKTEAITLEIE